MGAVAFQPLGSRETDKRALYIKKRDLHLPQKRLTSTTKEPYTHTYRHICSNVGAVAYQPLVSRETYKRDLHLPQKRPTSTTKETYLHQCVCIPASGVERDVQKTLIYRKKRPTPTTKETYIYHKRALYTNIQTYLHSSLQCREKRTKNSDTQKKEQNTQEKNPSISKCRLKSPIYRHRYTNKHTCSNMAQQCSSLRISIRSSKSGSCRPGIYNMFSFLYAPKFLCATPNRSRVALIHIYYPLHCPIFQHIRILYVQFQVGVVSPWYTHISPFIFLHIQILYAQLQIGDGLPCYTRGFTRICEYM